MILNFYNMSVEKNQMILTFPEQNTIPPVCSGGCDVSPKPARKPFCLIYRTGIKIIFYSIVSILTQFVCQIDSAAGKEGTFDTPKKMITLRECLDLAVKNSNDLEIIQDRRLITQLELENVEASEKWPQVSLSLGWVYGDESDAVFDSETLKGSLLLSHNIFNFFQNIQAMWKSVSNVTEAEIKEEQEKIRLYLDVGKAYFDLLAAQKQLKQSELKQERLKRNLARIRILHQNGIASKFELAQADTAFYRTKIGIDFKKQKVSLAEMTLAKTIGMPLDARLAVVEINYEKPFSLGYEACADYALNHRREFVIQKALMEKIPFYRKRIKRGKWPKLSAGIFLGDEFVYNTLEEENRVGIRLTFTKPIFDAGITDRKMQQLDIRLRVAMKTIVQFKKAYLDNLKMLYVQLVNSQVYIEKMKDQLDLELKISDMVQERYDLRASTLKDLLDAQDRDKRLRDEYSEALINHMKSRFLLKIIIGMKPFSKDFFDSF